MIIGNEVTFVTELRRCKNPDVPIPHNCNSFIFLFSVYKHEDQSIET